MLRILLFAAIAACIAVAVPPWLGHYLLTDRPDHATGRNDVAVAPDPPIAAASVQGRDGVEIEADGRGHFLAGFRINGRPVEGLIDTGASLVALNRSTARRLGIAVAQSDFRHRVVTANGTVAAARTTLRRVELRSIRVDNVEALVLDDDSLSVTLIGMSFLNRLTSFQSEDGRLTLRR